MLFTTVLKDNKAFLRCYKKGRFCADSFVAAYFYPNGSPYNDRKHAMREDVLTARVAETGLPIVYVNQLGGQDDLVYDGGSMQPMVHADCLAARTRERIGHLKQMTEG